MITLQPLLSRTCPAVFGILFSAGVLAQESFCPKSFEVLERGKKSNYTFVSRELENLYCTDRFEGAHFKIVLSTGKEAIPFDHEDKDLVRKAANVYHHLTIARKFWMTELRSKYVASLKQITIRLDITNAFSSARHFKHAEQEKNFNNAWSIPEGESPVIRGEKNSWYKEIWFSPMKKIEARKTVESKGENPVHESLVLVKDPIVELNANAVIYLGLNWLKTSSVNNSMVLEDALKRLGTIAVLFAALETTKHMDKWFINKYYYIETAMVPEIIYHEFAHIAMSDTMKTVHSVPVIEGMADYFAARIAGRRKMYDELKGFSNNRAKDTNNKMLYSPYLEGAWNSTSDFTLGLLWAGKEAFDKVNAERVAKGQEILVNYDDLVFTAHFDLSETSDIMHGLNSALVNSCKKKCANLRPGVNTLNYVFEKKGFN